MKKYLALIVAFSLSVLYPLAWAERGAVEPGNSPTEPGEEQTERRKPPGDSQREQELVRVQSALSNKTQAVSQQSGIVKKTDDAKQSIIRNLK